MEFFINKGSNLPSLHMELIKDGRNDYKNFHDKIQNADIFFTMTDVDTGVKKIAKQPATCLLRVDSTPDCGEEYYITYDWRTKDTNRPGRYIGKFSIEFLDGSGTLIVPIRDQLFINVLEGSIKK